jgi:NADH-quinone oxidoreductase subunit G
MKAAQNIGVIKDGWNGFNVLHTAAGRVGALDVVRFPRCRAARTPPAILKGAKAGDIEVVYLLGVDEMDMGAAGRCLRDLPGQPWRCRRPPCRCHSAGCAYTEKSVTYVNTEGRPQMTRRANFPPGDAREDWAIIRALAGKLDVTLGFDNLDHLAPPCTRPHRIWPRWTPLKPADTAQLGDMLMRRAR